MASRPEIQTALPTVGRLAKAVYRFLASLKLAVILIVILAAVLAGATVLEARKGIAYAYWYVYGSRWFVALLALLAVNILAAVLIRFPWKRRQTGFVITHAGLLVLLLGSIQTFLAGIEGQLSFMEGETADTILLADRSQLKVVGHGQSGQLSTDFSFSPGPVGWGSDEPLDFGQAHGIGLKVLEFYPHARPEVDWIPDDSGLGGPALKFALAGTDGQRLGEFWRMANPFGSPPVKGQPKVTLQRATAGSMLDDFLNPPFRAHDAGLRPPADEAARDGILSVHYKGQMYRIAVHENLGKRVPVGDSGLSVEIVEYYPTAVSRGSGRFASISAEPKNPMLQLRVHLPDREEPIPEIAYAKIPFVNYQLMRETGSPLKFWYYHPAVSAPSGAEFLQTPDGKLFCRVGIEGQYQPRGEVKEGDRIKVSADFQVSILKYIPHARKKLAFQPVQLAPGERPGPEAAALVELTADGKTQQVWLQRNDRQYGLQEIQTAAGPALLGFGYERLPLGFSLKLLDFKRGLNPGRMGDASFASEVQLVDNTRGIDQKRKISMNNPLVHDKFAFYQSSFKELPGGREVSVLSVARDPGRLLKYLGSLMICVGIFITYYMKAVFRSKAPLSAFKGRTAEDKASSPQSDTATRSVSCAT